jgi:TonB-linked SusC/RagA family outer membrane protein
MSSMRNTVLRVLFLAGAFLGSTAAVAAAQQGSVTGRVTDQANGQAVVGARVQIVGTTIAGVTNAEGRFRFNGVPVGPQTVRVVALGYGAMNKVATVVANEVATVDFAVSLTAFSLGEFVVTATGEQQKREIGNAISTVDVSDLSRTAPVQNMGDLLAARAPGVQVLPGNLTGGGSRIRIRGNSSLSLSNNPIYIVDGARIWSDVNSSSIGIGGTNPSRVNDLNPEDIESIDVVRGPSAATLYGTDAANGVIVIKTKRGRAGKPQWNFNVEQGWIKDQNQYPIAYRGWRNTSTISNTTQCLISNVIAGTCVQDSVSSYNLFEDPDVTPNGTGYRQQYGLNVRGGTEAVTYYLSGEWEDETGYLQMGPVFEQFYREKYSVNEIPEKTQRPNGLTRTSLRTNVTARISQDFDVDASIGYVTSLQRLPQTDNNTTGLLSNAYGGPGFKTNQVVHASGQSARQNYGYRLYTPDEFFTETVEQGINRTTMSGTANYRPTTWLSFKATGGYDFTSRKDTDLCERNKCSPFGSINPVGFKSDNRTENFVWTGDVVGNANYDLLDNLRARTSLGWQYGKERFNRNGTFSYDLPPGATTVTAGAVPSAEESTVQSATLGYFAEQWFGWRDRMFLTLAVRSDKNSAFGAEFDRVYYPKAALSWVISDEGFMGGRPGFLNELRLRGAYGSSGRQPGPNDAIAFYTPSTASVDGADTPTLVVSSVGNPDLKPERSTELELGFDLSVLDSKLNLEFTWFNKSSKDALISRQLPPSLGAVGSRFENIGEVNNKGFEAVVNAVVINTAKLGWDLTFAGAYTKNEIIDLGGLPPIVGTTTTDREGYPIQGWWQRPYTYEDTNGDGLIARGEVVVGDTNVYVGPSFPPTELTLFTGFEFLNRKVRLQANLDSKLGGYQLNGTERIRCQSRLNCRAVIDPTAPTWEQARAVANRETGTATQYGFMEKTDFLRIREVSVTWTMPDAWARTLRASRLSLTAAGRNLAVFTNYTGLDPESGYFGTNIGVVSDFQTAPPPSYYTFRLNVAF